MVILGIMIPVNFLVSVYNVGRDLWSKRKVICYYFKKVVLRQTQVIRLRQEITVTSATEENLNTESHALPTSRGGHEVFERNAPDRQLRIVIEDCKVENILDEVE